MDLKILGAAVLVGVSAFTGSAIAIANDAPGIVNVQNDRGGVVIDYAIRVLEIKRDGTPVRVSGACSSACTLFLMLPPEQLCITQRASFGFHLPYGVSPRGNRIAATYLRKSYPSWVQAWIAGRGGLSKSMKTMNYKVASRFLRTCGDNAKDTSRIAAGRGLAQVSIY